MAAITRSIQLACSAQIAWKFLSDGDKWPRWAIRNVLASRPAGPDRWEIQTPRGSGILHIHAIETYGNLDHDFIDPRQGKWTVPARVVPLSNGSMFMLTLEPPSGMPSELFERGLEELDHELRELAKLAPSL